MFTLREICHLTTGNLLRGDPDTVVEHIHFDSRQMTKNGLFIALTGGDRDGHTFLSDAAEHQAKAALISDPSFDTTVLPAVIQVSDTEKALQTLAKAYRQSLTIPIIAVTGSNGKTTTKDMIAHLLQAKYYVYKTHQNLNNHLGLPLSLLQIKPYHQAAVLELGMNHAGEIDFLADIAQPDCSVITNVNDAHIEFFGTQEAIARAKAELLPHTRKDGLALLNGDQAHVRTLADRSPAPVRFFGRHSPENDIQLVHMQHTSQGTECTIRIRKGPSEPFVDESFFVPLYGEHNLYNLLPALYIGFEQGMNLTQTEMALQNLEISAMRFQRVSFPGKPCMAINDAYNASPASMKKAVDTFMDIDPERKKIIVLGDIYELGEHEDALHKEVGDYLNRYRPSIHLLVTVGTSSKAIAQRFSGPSEHVHDKTAVAERLVPFLDEEAALLFKASRGMKLESVIDRLQETLS